MKKRTVLLIVLACMIVCGIFVFEKQTSFLNKLTKNDIVLDGELVFRREDGVSSYHITEIHEGNDYSIQHPDTTYLKQDGQFYIDTGDGPEVIADSITTESEIVEMFGRKSVLGGHDFSDLKLKEKYSTTIPSLLNEDEISCVCEEYLVSNEEADDNTDAVLKIYYVEKEPYAIQAREDNRFMYYITSWE